MRTFIVVGANPRSSSLGARDRLIPEPAAVDGLLARLRASGVPQAVVMTTCERIEVYSVAPEGRAETRRGVERIVEMLAHFSAMPTAEVERHICVYTGDDAVRHVFAVAATLDSTVIGDPHLIAQLKSAYRVAQRAGSLGEELDGLLQAAFAAAKHARAETAIGKAPVSLAAAAVDLARRVHGDLAEVRALLLGISDIGEVISAALRAAGLANLTLVHPNAARAEDAARQLDCHLAAYPPPAGELAHADIIVGCLGARRYVIVPDAVERALRARRYRPLLLVDTAVPGDVDPAVNAIDAAFLYDLDDLEKVARIGRGSRESEAARARAIVEQEACAFLRRRAERAAVPVLNALRGRFEASRDIALRDAGGDAEKATRLLINRLLHRPSTALRAAADTAAGEGAADLEEFERALTRLFGLDGAPGETDE